MRSSKRLTLQELEKEAANKIIVEILVMIFTALFKVIWFLICLYLGFRLLSFLGLL